MIGQVMSQNLNWTKLVINTFKNSRFYRFLIIFPFLIVYYSCIDGFEIVNKIDFENAIPKIPQKSIGFNCQMNGEYDKSM